MENEVPSIHTTARKWGIISGLVGIANLLIVDMAGLAGNSAAQWIGVVVTAVLIFLAHREFKAEGDGYMSYGQGLGIGTLAAVYASVISSIFTYIYISFVSSSIMDAAREKSIMDMEDQGMSDAEIDQAMELAGIFMSPGGIAIMGIIFGVFFGFIVALLVSIFTKNENPELS